MSISQRTTKLILATCLACLLAYFLNLSSAVSAGIIALLSLSDTRRSTLKLARNRLFSMLLALAIGVLAFHLSGFHIWSLGLYLALYVPLAYKMGWEIGITPSTVLVSHLLVQESTSPDLLVWGPDRHLGDYIRRETGADMLLWQGSCIVHNEFKGQELAALKAEHPDAVVLVHPESPQSVIELGDVVGSTSKLLKAAVSRPEKKFMLRLNF